MKTISTNKQLSNQLLRLINKYPNMAFATAWASAGTDVFRSILESKRNIIGAVIGTHFYQTDPDVLDYFVGSKKVKFILQSDGVFHPKVYIFWDGPEWEIIIGSANLTAGALSVNSELSILISHQDGTPSLKDEFENVLNGYLDGARTINQDEADSYRRLWLLKKSDLKRISGQYGSQKSKKLAMNSAVMSMDWPTFLERVKQDKHHGIDGRIRMLKVMNAQFTEHAHFNDMELDVRLGIAGLKCNFCPHSRWFGSMLGAGHFRQAIKNGERSISLALDQIPLQGCVTKAHFKHFISEFQKAFSGGGARLATASRLLAMKRPDTFVCVSGANRRMLSEDMGINRPDKLDYERYWEEVILPLKDSPWWQSPKPSKPKDQAVWQRRAAMLDAIFYEPKKLSRNPSQGR